jgi:hypothetical protein
VEKPHDLPEWERQMVTFMPMSLPFDSASLMCSFSVLIAVSFLVIVLDS